MSELVAFLLARLDDDEAVARAAVIPGYEGDYKPHPEYAEWFVGDTGEVEYVQTPEALAHRYPDRLYVTCDGEGLTPSVDGIAAEHIARFDPARVLAEVDAKRRIVELHRPSYAVMYRESDRLLADAFDSLTVPTVAHSGPVWPTHESEATLRLLAVPFADHPDYDERWRP